MEHSVIFNNVTKKYKMYQTSSDRLKGVLAPDRYGEDFYAVQNITFSTSPGDVIGVVGVNGAGKSTLSNLIAGIAPQTSGEIKVNGQVSIIAISSGLDNELTGRDNIEYKCLMLGFKRKEIQELIPKVIDFADIGNFIDQPVKNYSSGMRSRLGFAISVNIDPDVLVVDEALSVGDQTFKEKCYDKMNEFKEKGKTIFFVSHSLQQIRRFCAKVLWLEAGEVRAYGKRKVVLPKYRKFLKDFKALSDEEQRNFRQQVIERRSKMQSQEIKEESVVQRIPRMNSRVQRNKKRSIFTSRKWKLMIILLLITTLCVATYIGKPWEMFTKDKSEQVQTPADDNDNKGEKDLADETEGKQKIEAEIVEENIRYVMVENASIRSSASLDSELVGYANFGEAYKIEKTEENLSDEIEWLKVNSKTTDKSGWISSNVMEEISESVNDVETAEKIKGLIGTHSFLEEVSKMTAADQIEDSTDSEEADNKQVSIVVQDTSKAELVDELSEPQLEMDNKVLYHGSDFNFIFTLENEQVQDLFIEQKVEKDR